MSSSVPIATHIRETNECVHTCGVILLQSLERVTDTNMATTTISSFEFESSFSRKKFGGGGGGATKTKEETIMVAKTTTTTSFVKIQTAGLFGRKVVDLCCSLINSNPERLQLVRKTMTEIVRFLQVAPVAISLDDLDELISSLSPEEMEELGKVDPDVRTQHSQSDLTLHMNKFSCF